MRRGLKAGASLRGLIGCGVADRSPMRRGLKGELARGEVCVAARVADRSPMRRGLKGKRCSRSCPTSWKVADRSPMRRGLKGRSKPASAARPCRSCRPLPDEEGTERCPWEHRRIRARRVADRSPMRRGLKGIRKVCLTELLGGCRPLPDEEGTERLLDVKACLKTLPYVADRSPMRRGLKAPVPGRDWSASAELQTAPR